MTTSVNTLSTSASPVAGESVFARFQSLSIAHSVLSQIPYRIAVEYFVLPYGVDEQGRIEALMAYPSDAVTLQCVQVFTGLAIKPLAMPREDLVKLIRHHYGALAQDKRLESASQQQTGPSRLSFNRSDSVITSVDTIVQEAIRLRASDIHMEPFEREMRIRYRVDGVLQEMLSVAPERVAATTSRVKIMAGMDIAEKRRPQDGKIRITENGADVDIRVSSLPTDFGEKIVMRLLDKASFDYNVETIGMDQPRLALFKRALEMPNGIIVLTGPTGSGKTTSLYAAINYIRKPGINISTVEDPIEYNITGVNQTQVNLLTGMTFAASLRTLLRQDPDVIMVGEMRDQETAEIAIRSSLTGHLVLSTLHTNDAPSAVTRLIDMGVEPYLVSSSLTVIVAQRLVRKICEHCKCEDVVSEEVKESIGLPAATPLFRGLGCTACGHTGYRGRIGIFEVLPITDSLRRLISQKVFTTELRDQAAKEGLVTLREDALAKLTHGTTSLEEVMREISVIA